MTIDQYFTIFIFIHAVCGSISLFLGTISVIAKKGGKLHKKSGKFFYYGMVAASTSGIIASLIPEHLNPFLFVVGLFSLYLVLTGYRALNFKTVKERKDLVWDIRISWAMVIVGVIMMLLGTVVWIQGNVMGVILIAFGGLGIFNARLDFRAFRDLATLRKKSLRLHIGKISGAYIAAFTAFFVTNNVLPPLVSWLLPTIFGLLFIGYWLGKTKPARKPTVQS